MNKRFWLVLALVILPLTLALGSVMVSALPTPAAPVNTIAVDTPADEMITNGNCALREAIIAANGDSAVDNCPAGTGADTIILPAGTYSLTVGTPNEDLANGGDLDILGSLTIVGAGADATIIDGNGLDRVLDVNPALTPGVGVTIAGVTIRNGLEDTGGGIENGGVLTVTHSIVSGNTARRRGAGIRNRAGTLTIVNSSISGNIAGDRGSGIWNEAGTLSITGSTISGNIAADRGGGILNEAGTLSIANSTVSGNSAVDGGGIRNDGQLTIGNSLLFGNLAAEDGGGLLHRSGAATLNNVTIADNVADENADGVGEGGGIRVVGGTLTVRNSIVAGNRDDSVTIIHPDCSGVPGQALSSGYNLVGDAGGCNWLATIGDQVGDSTNPIDALLAPMADHGGPTLTCALLPGSPAIDAGNPATPSSGGNACEASDQRGMPRGEHGAACDIGAFETVSPIHLPIVLNAHPVAVLAD